MYSNTTPPSPAYAVEEKGGNCIIIAPFPSSSNINSNNNTTSYMPRVIPPDPGGGSNNSGAYQSQQHIVVGPPAEVAGASSFTRASRGGAVFPRSASGGSRCRSSTPDVGSHSREQPPRPVVASLSSTRLAQVSPEPSRGGGTPRSQFSRRSSSVLLIDSEEDAEGEVASQRQQPQRQLQQSNVDEEEVMATSGPAYHCSPVQAHQATSGQDRSTYSPLPPLPPHQPLTQDPFLVSTPGPLPPREVPADLQQHAYEGQPHAQNGGSHTTSASGPTREHAAAAGCGTGRFTCVPAAATAASAILGPLILLRSCSRVVRGKKPQRKQAQRHEDPTYKKSDDTEFVSAASPTPPLVAQDEDDNDDQDCGDEVEDDVKEWAVQSSVERHAQRTYLRRLRARLRETQDLLAAAQKQQGQRAEALAAQAIAERRQAERQRREDFQRALDGLREENATLTERLEAVTRASAMELAPTGTATGGHTYATGSTAVAALTTITTTGSGSGTASLPVSALQEAEWSRRLGEVEAYWRERLRAAERHWTAEANGQQRERAEVAAQLRELTRTCEELQETRRHLTGECTALRAENARLRDAPSSVVSGSKTGMPSSSGGRGTQSVRSTQELEDEVIRLHRELQEQQERGDALMAELDGSGERQVRMEQAHAQEVVRLQGEAARERERAAQLVQLYGSQVQSLHAQLRDVQGQRAELAAALEVLRGRQ